MKEVRLSRLAQQDLIAIWRKVAEDNGPATADQWIDRIERRCQQLASFPQSGPARPDIAFDARMLVIGRWLALYRVEAGGVRIMRVTDAAQDLGEIDFSDE
ncbi:putative plasmid stabilization system [Bradyrhizobium sp. ORS 285]|uniref:type II toxin-antitoxin system RelE/ParE family toxin n=1 Tax=Bradyrhizobium sp. ORS 285 TaxID=115808 RepID=UPI000240ABA1|nr:type II toxin-antitoxin system RelE/ParE family toxin [Bradyrhizobium sp. ORS 285]CCD86467.1 putative plasmid stabilization system [Bradyrhizobium sp. ORS 285]SMX62334.1 putative plasmid stabilization system [Bradyrhizobium sp. ORS 285]